MITILRWILLPFTLLYTLIIWIRNKLYDWRMLKSKAYPIRTIVIGNLAVGGSGKTPMTEYLIHWLHQDFNIATLSRGYGRKTKGFRYVESDSTAIDVGDEPLQFKHTFPNITVAVCEDRRSGIETLMPGHDLILLDDAFQHRRISASCNILLFDYTSIMGCTILLPTGDFRDLLNQTQRADIVVITKCPTTIPKEIKRKIEAKLFRYGQKPVFYSHIVYKKAVNVFNEAVLQSLDGLNILLLTGIANPKPLIEYLQVQAQRVVSLAYPDHHTFLERDYQKIRNWFAGIDATNKIILTTTKDLQRMDLDQLQGFPLYHIPISTALEGESRFRKEVMNLIGAKV